MTPDTQRLIAEPQWLIVVGTPGKDPLTFVGPFADSQTADAALVEYQRLHPGVPAMTDILVSGASLTRCSALSATSSGGRDGHE